MFKIKSIRYTASKINSIILGIKSKRTLMPLQDGDVLETYADISRIKNDVFYEPKVDIQTGMKKFVEWYLMYGKAR